VKRGEVVSIREVARQAGVSQATAARALGGYGRTSAATSARVLAAAAQLGYRPNELARSMVTKTTHTIGLVLADIQNPFFARIARAVADVARQRGYALLLANTDNDLIQEREAVRVLAAKQVDGLIVVPSSHTDGAHLAALAPHGIPIVLLDRLVDGLVADTVMVDNDTAAFDAIAHLTALGHRRIALITGSETLASTAARIAGYRRALAAAGIPATEALVQIVPYTRAASAALTVELLNRPLAERPTAIFATDSLLTAGILEAIHAAGCAVPADLSLISFDDTEWATIVQPPLTVVEQPIGELGRLAAERLLARIGGDESPPQRHRLAATLLLRQSCAPPPQIAAAAARRDGS
jgi:LacI family transcriptional regulator